MEKNYRLKKNHEIASVIRQKISVGNRFYAIYFVRNDYNTNKIAISVSKKYGGAVQRNYAKRVVREIMRPLLKEFQSLSVVIIVKDGSHDLDYNDKKREIEQLVRKIKKHNEEKTKNEIPKN